MPAILQHNKRLQQPKWYKRLVHSDEFLEFSIDQAKRKACSLIRSGFYLWQDRKDLQQELLVDLLTRLRNVDTLQGEWRGLVCTIIGNRAAVLANKSSWNRMLPIPEEGEEDGKPDPQLEHIVTRTDVERLIHKLPRRLRPLARDLKYFTIPEICLRGGKSRARIYQMYKEIKEILRVPRPAPGTA